jgi:hypothetical protein
VLLWEPEILPTDPAFPREMRNIYRLGGEDIQRGTISLKIVVGSGTDQERSSGSGAPTFLQVFGLAQRTNPSAFDVENRLWPRLGDPNQAVNAGGTNAKLIRDYFVVFPSLRPFAGGGLARPPDPVNDSLYRTPDEDLISQRRPPTQYRLRARYQAAIEHTFESLLGGSRFDVAYDREALRGLMDLAPPGLDELFAVLSIVEALLERHPPVDVVVLDTAPTGHALRLLEMPATALGWVHALLAILLKYREVVGLGEVAAELVATARRLRELGALLTDAGRARAVAVTRAAELPQRETARLLARLGRLRVAVPAVVVNALGAEGCPRCAKARRAEARVVAALRRQRATGRRPWGIISTPAAAPPPRGVAALARWAHTWKLE